MECPIFLLKLTNARMVGFRNYADSHRIYFCGASLLFTSECGCYDSNRPYNLEHNGSDSHSTITTNQTSYEVVGDWILFTVEWGRVMRAVLHLCQIVFLRGNVPNKSTFIHFQATFIRDTMGLIVYYHYTLRKRRA